MKTEYIEETTSNVQNVTFGYWDENEDKWIPITMNNREEVAEILKSSPDLINALISTFEDLIDKVNADLLAIWVRMNMLEKRWE